MHWVTLQKNKYNSISANDKCCMSVTSRSAGLQQS